MIEAGMGMMKTVMTMRYFKTHQFKYPRMLAIGNCRQQIASTMGTLTKYMDQVQWHTYTEEGLNLSKCDHLVIEFESLWRLGEAGCAEFDLVFLDECRSILKTSTVFTTNKQNIFLNNQVLVAVCSKAKTTIMCDADASIDTSCANLMDRLYKEDEIKHLLYTHQKIKRTVEVYKNHWDVLPLLYDDVLDGNCWAFRVARKAGQSFCID
jgi:hypothetical protein